MTYQPFFFFFFFLAQGRGSRLTVDTLLSFYTEGKTALTPGGLLQAEAAANELGRQLVMASLSLPVAWGLLLVCGILLGAESLQGMGDAESRAGL